MTFKVGDKVLITRPTRIPNWLVSSMEEWIGKVCIVTLVVSSHTYHLKPYKWKTKSTFWFWEDELLILATRDNIIMEML